MLDPAASCRRLPSWPIPVSATYLVLFGATPRGCTRFTQRGDQSQRLQDLRDVLKFGPAAGAHSRLVGGLRRFSDDIGGTAAGGRRVPGRAQRRATELGALVGQPLLDYTRHNRALLVDRHENRTELIVPFVRPGRLS